MVFQPFVIRRFAIANLPMWRTFNGSPCFSAAPHHSNGSPRRSTDAMQRKRLRCHDTKWQHGGLRGR